MSIPPVIVGNRINPLSRSTVEQTTVPYDEVTLCTDPNCPVCRAQRRDKRHRDKKHETKFWKRLSPRVESASTIVSIHSIELNERRPYDTERAVVPVDHSERQVVSTTTRTNRLTNKEVIRDTRTTNDTNDNEVVCCRAYNGCRCSCWYCILLILLLIILIIILIILLATFL